MLYVHVHGLTHHSPCNGSSLATSDESRSALMFIAYLAILIWVIVQGLCIICACTDKVLAALLIVLT